MATADKKLTSAHKHFISVDPLAREELPLSSNPMPFNLLSFDALSDITSTHYALTFLDKTSAYIRYRYIAANPISPQCTRHQQYVVQYVDV